jgi:NOL1/NOP2/fmu family ribosome biogenesis protein
MKIRFIKSGEKKEIINELNEIYGISSLPYLLIESGKEKIRAFSGHLSKEEIVSVSDLAGIEGIGLYLTKKYDGLRLSFDAAHVLKGKITKGIFHISHDQYKSWMRGEDLDIPAPKGMLVMEHDGIFFGCGKSNGEKIFNHVPKERRVRQ